jgi:hypothetical protein
MFVFEEHRLVQEPTVLSRSQDVMNALYGEMCLCLEGEFWL